MKSIVVFFLIGLVSASTWAEDSQNIKELYQRWAEAVEKADIDSYVSVLHPQVKLMPPQSDPFEGKEQYRKFLEPVFSSAVYRIDVELEPEIELIGDVALAEYEYVIHMDLKDGKDSIDQEGALMASRNHNVYFDVLVRGSSGKWEVYRHTWRSK